MTAGSHNEIWELVKRLLHDHDCVIIPAFGGFVCNREPARIDQISHVILPPGKRIVFNQNLKTNDGLLAGKLAEKASTTYNQAVQQIEELVQHVMSSLQDKKQFTIDSFGSFRLNAEANFVFLPDKKENYLYTSYGLQPVQAEYVATGYARIRKTRIFKEHKPLKPARNVTQFWPKALVAVLVLMLFVNGWIYFRENPQSGIHMGNASMNISAWFDSVFNKQEDSAVASLQPLPVLENAIDTTRPVSELIPENPLSTEFPQTDTMEVTSEPAEPSEETYQPYRFGEHLAAARIHWYIPSVPGNLNLQVIPEPATGQQQESIQSETTPVEPDHDEAAISSGIRGSFYVIGGVFCKAHNAEQFQAELVRKGYRAEVLNNPEIQCKRVSYASFSNKQEAELKLLEIKTSENPDAWLLEIR